MQEMNGVQDWRITVGIGEQDLLLQMQSCVCDLIQSRRWICDNCSSKAWVWQGVLNAGAQGEAILWQHDSFVEIEFPARCKVWEGYGKSWNPVDEHASHS